MILICFWKIRPSLAKQLKRVAVLRQDKLQKTMKITFPGSQVICAYNAWFCHEHCSSEQFRRVYSVRTSTLQNLVGNQWATMGICCLAPYLSAAAIQPFSFLHCQHTALCASLTCSHLTEGTHQKWWCISNWAEKINWLHNEWQNVDRNVKSYHFLVNNHWIGQYGGCSAPDQVKPGCLSSGRFLLGV